MGPGVTRVVAAAQTVLDDLGPQLCGQSVVGQYMIDRLAYRFGAVVGMGQRFLLGGCDVERHGWCRCDENDTGESRWAACGQQLGGLAAHRVADEDVPAEVARLDDVLGVIGKLFETERTRHHVRGAPAPLVVGNDAVT
jgi:hypothetical protein